MQPKQNNPAARLHRILTALRAQSDGTRLIDAWRAILGIKAPNNDHNLTFFRRYGRLLALPERVRAALLGVPDISNELYLRWIPKIETAFINTSLGGNVASFWGLFERSSLEFLEFCADILSRDRPERTLTTEDLAKILRDVEELRQDVNAPDINQSLRAYVLEGLDEIESAIADYDIDGIASIEHCTERAVGRLLLTQDQIARSSENSVLRRFKRVVYSLVVMMSAANGAIQLPHNIHEFLAECRGIEQRQLTYNQSTAKDIKSAEVPSSQPDLSDDAVPDTSNCYTEQT